MQKKFSLLIGFSLLLSAQGTILGKDTNGEKWFNETLPETWGYNYMSQPMPDEDQWWKEFSDPVLDSLIQRGVNENFNVSIAAKRIEIARQTIRQSQSAYYPSFDFSGGWTKSRQSGATTLPVHSASNISYYSAGVDMNWQIDIFGKISSGVKQKKSQWKASRAEYAATMVTMCSDIATAYFNLRVAQSELAVAKNHVASQNRVVEITKARHEAGLASMLDVAQSQTVLYSTEATIPSLESQINSYLNAIAVLTGSIPGEAPQSLTNFSVLPDYIHIVMAGIPADLLRRRPDIAVAEQNLAAAASAVGIAKKDFLPTLSLNGSIGTSAHKAEDLMTNNSFTYSIAPTLSWNIFSGFSRKAALASAKENMEIEIENYNQTVLTAIQETDNALSNYYNTLQQIEAYKKVVESSQKTYDLSIDLYKRGLSSFTNVADAQINLLTYANSLIVAHGQALIALVDVYKALGGGWRMPTDF